MKAMGKRAWASLAVLVLLAFAWTSCGDDETGSNKVVTPVVASEGTAEMAVDAVSGGEITAATEVRGTGPFDIDINVLAATTGYQAYQYYLEWDPNLLALDEHRDLKPDGLELCAKPAISADVVAAGCVNVTEATTFAGPVSTITFHCVANGTSVLHLLTSAEDPASYSTAMAPRGVVVQTNLTDASVTCLGS